MSASATQPVGNPSKGVETRRAVQPRSYDADEEYDTPGLDGILASTETLLAVNRGHRPPDARDSLEFKRFYTTADLLRERVALDPEKSRRKMLAYAARRRNLDGWAPFALDNMMLGHIIGNPLTAPGEETNPMQIAGQARRITQMGPGGVGSDNAITEGMQNVDASQFGFISPLEGPECHDGTTYVHTDKGLLPWVEVAHRALDKGEELAFLCWVEERQRFLPAERVVREHHQGDIYLIDNGHISLRVTGNHRLWVSTVTEPRRRQYLTAQEAYEQATEQREGFWMFGAHPINDCSATFYFDPTAWRKEPYDADVFCATVPGGLLLTAGTATTLSVWSGNSERIGVDARLAWGVRYGTDGRIYQRFRDRNGREVWMSPRDLAGKTIRLPD